MENQMKPAVFCLVVALAITTLVVAILFQKPKPKTKEGFLDLNQSIPMGVGIGLLVLLAIFAVFFLFFYSYPKKPNVVPRLSMYYNME